MWKSFYISTLYSPQIWTTTTITEIVTSSQKLIFDCLNMCSGRQFHCCFEFFPFACGHASEGQIEGHLGIFVESGFSGGGTGIVSTARKIRYTLQHCPMDSFPKGSLELQSPVCITWPLSTWNGTSPSCEGKKNIKYPLNNFKKYWSRAKILLSEHTEWNRQY